MVIIIVQDALMSQSLYQLLLRMGKEALIIHRISEAATLMAANRDLIEAVILDSDIDIEQSKWFLQNLSLSHPHCSILVYSDFPEWEAMSEINLVTNLRIRKKPFILDDILTVIQCDTRRNNVSH